MTAVRTPDPLAVSVRVATSADTAALVRLYHGFMLHEGAEPPLDAELWRRLERLLASDWDEVLIARAARGEAVGYLQQRYFLSVWRPDLDAFIEDVFVVEKARGRRVGERLLELAFDRARIRGVRRICLDTNENNIRGGRLYERLGFENRSAVWQNGRQIYYSRLL